MTVTLNGFELGEIDSGIVETSRQKASAFKKAGTRTALPLTGTIIKGVTGVTSRGTGEGKAKIASGTGTSVPMGANKFVSVIVETDEAWNYSDTIANALLAEQPIAHSRAYDNYVAGLVPLPAEFSNFVSFGTGLTTIEIATGADASEGLDDVADAVAEGVISAYVLSTAMLAYLKRQRVAATGARTFDISGNTDEGFIDGVPYYTFTSAVKVGFAGNFAKFYYGDITFEGDAGYDVKDQGNITDSDGVDHNLTSENKKALFNEVFQGAQVSSKANFVKIVPAPAA